MDPRRQIPVLSLLGLCLTVCTQGDDPPAIVGTWMAIEVDMEKFPMVEMGEGYSARYGVLLRIDDDLSGSFGYYATYTSNGVGQRNEQHQPALVDADDAPRYLITVDDLSGGRYDDDDGEEAALPGQPGVAAGRIELAWPGPLRARHSPQAADDKAVFDCTLDEDRLDCTLTGVGKGAPELWKFARKLEET